MSADDKRQAARLLSEYEVLLTDPEAGFRDERGIAHDVSRKGFRVETPLRLRTGQRLEFALLIEGAPALGEARVVWVNPGALSTWAGLAFTRISWRDRRRVARYVEPSSADFTGALATALKAAFGMALLYVAALAASSRLWWDVAYPLLPVMLALILAVWSGRKLLDR